MLLCFCFISLNWMWMDIKDPLLLIRRVNLKKELFRTCLALIQSV